MSRASRAVMVTFALNGAAFATFASRLPNVKTELALSSAGLGLLLLAISLGSVTGLPMSGWLTGRFGARRTVLAGSAATTLGYVAAAFGAHFDQVWLAAIGLYAAGWGIGTWDVSMNLEGTSVERRLRRSIMPHYHAMFSAGTVAAALLGAAVTAADVPVWLHVTVLMALVAATNLAVTADFLPMSTDRTNVDDPDRADEKAAEPGGAASPSYWAAWRDPRVLLIGVVTLVAGFTEGTANDWMSIAFVEGHHVPAWAGVLAFAAFLTFMTLGRLAGTSLLDRFGRVPTLRVAFALAVAGCLLVVFGPTPVAYVGVLIWGLGACLGFPVGMSAAGDDPRQAHARISVVSTIAYGSFLAGPPLLGFLGEHVGVLHALLAVGAAALVALALVPAVREPETRT